VAIACPSPRCYTAHRLDRTFWAVCFPIAIIGSITWLAIFEYNYHPRLSRYSKGVTILRVGDSELDFNHPAGTFTIPRQTGRRNVRVWPRYRETP